MQARISLVERPDAAAAFDARPCQLYKLGRVPYRDAWELQRQWVELRRAGEIPDRLLLLEHPPVITLGRNARREHLLSSPEILAAEGIEVVETNRGGDVTFHGPGQLVGYPVLDLSPIRKDVVWYVRTLEEAIIRTLNDLGLAAGRRAGMTGVWVGESKVAAIGIHISRWITSHGFALNVETDLSSFRHIVPCGISSYPVTSLQELLGTRVDRAPLEDQLSMHLGGLLGLEMEWTALQYSERRKRCLPPMC
ncbi:MAG: lipoyl(octanoyl) transferase LipB [Acidobacteria bacterium]|nr:lipoyl(octanoyl) transferase LipB [Acidobacteriota bacterium]